MKKIRLRIFEEADVVIFEKWLYKAHVAKWYSEPLEWMNEIVKRDTEFSWVKHFIVEVDGKPIGFCQYYDYSLGGETWHGNMNVQDAYSIDYLIGESDYLGQGFGTAIVLKLVEEIQNNTSAKKIIVQPEKDNNASRNTLRSAGLLYDDENDVFYKEIVKQ